MRKVVGIASRKFEDYKPFLSVEDSEEIKRISKVLKGKKIGMYSATSFGGGVAEILQSMIPLMRDLGIDVEWEVLEADNSFFNITKKMHNGLQGHEGYLTREEKELYLRVNEENAKSTNVDLYDIVVVHDPQPIPMIEYSKDKKCKWIWRCHIDTSNANPAYWDFIFSFMKKYDATIFTMKDFIKETYGLSKVVLIPPSIDPLSEKNRELSESEISEVFRHYDVDMSKPMLVQVSRFDPWKDPIGVVDIYRRLKEDFDIQLAMIGSMASDDPEGWLFYDRLLRHVGEDFDVKVLTNFNGVGAYEVNAFQRGAFIVLQKSIKEGFGLTVTEGLWKERPVIGGNVGGITLQIEDGVNGYLVNNSDEAYERTKYLLLHPEEALKLGKNGKEYVKKKFLITRHMMDYLRLFVSL